MANEGINITMRLEGGKRLERAFKDPRLVQGPIREFLEKSGRTVEGKAKENVVVDTGRLRSSITTEVRTDRAIVGSNVKYAPHVEFGTRPHFPPLSAMQPWARRHGFPAGVRGAFMVARKIAQRGTEAKPYLLPALNKSAGAINRFLEQAANEIERRFSRGK